MKFIELLTAIETANIQYLVVGGMAVNFHGIIRPTQDIDLIVYLETDNLLKFCKLMTELGYRPKVPVKAEDLANPEKRRDWIQNKNMVVFCFYHQDDPMNVIDVFVEHPLPFQEIYGRRKLIPLGAVQISVISIPDLIKLKKMAGRIQDKADIRALRQVLELEDEYER